MDTKYFQKALDEFCLKYSCQIKVGDLTVGQFSGILLRAQELKRLDQEFEDITDGLMAHRSQA